MSTITSTSTNLTMFKIEGAFPDADSLFPVLASSLSRFAFRDISETNDENSTGWVHPEDHTSVAFSAPAFIWMNQFIFLSLRTDTRKVPAAVLKQECTDREAAWLSDHPETQLKRPPKKIREDIKEAAKLELLKKTLPVPKVFDAVIDTEKMALYLLTTSTKDVDQFGTMFKRTFGDDGLTIRQIIPWDFCINALSPNMPMLEKLGKLNQATSEALFDLCDSNQWVGQDLLLWIVSGQAEAALAGVSVWVDDRIVLMGAAESGKQKVVLTGPVGERMATLKSAIADGKQIVEATVHVEKNEGMAWKLTMDGRTFQVKGLKCPAVTLAAEDISDETTETQSLMLLKIGGIQDVIRYLLREFFERFLTDRLDRWDSVRAEIMEWVEG